MTKQPKSHFERSGECNKCGECCKRLPDWKDLDEITKAMFRQHDPNAEEIFRNVKHGVCDRLFICGLENVCIIYDEESRPQFCQNFPNHPDQIREIPKCSFKFARVKNKKE